jgi:poly(3-hydroxyalkanoate) synthetase
MERVLTGILRVLKSAKFKKFLAVAIIFCIGVLIGIGLGRASQRPESNSQSSTSLTSQQRTERNLERLEEGNERAIERIKRDVEAKRLKQEQADKITAKLEEIYTYKKEAIKQNSEEKQDELDKKRREWRNWIEENDLSSRYFIGVL